MCILVWLQLHLPEVALRNPLLLPATLQPRWTFLSELGVVASRRKTDRDKRKKGKEKKRCHVSAGLTEREGKCMCMCPSGCSSSTKTRVFLPKTHTLDPQPCCTFSNALSDSLLHENSRFKPVRLRERAQWSFPPLQNPALLQPHCLTDFSDWHTGNGAKTFCFLTQKVLLWS